MIDATLTAGHDLPHDINAIIEIPAEGGSVKYEVDKECGRLVVDRFMPTAMYYPCNYGYVPKTLAEDGDPADVLVLTPFPVYPGSLVRVRPIALLRMTDEAGKDSKILTAPIDKTCLQMQGIRDLNDVNDILLKKISHFFEEYKALEPNKWVKVDGWENKEAATLELMACVKRYEEQQVTA